MRSQIRDILWPFLTTRLLLILITYIGYVLFTSLTNYTNDPIDIIGLLTSWNHGDASRYLEIAQYGYRTQADLALFPLFPALIWLLGYLPGPGSFLLIGTLISNIALFGALLLLYRLTAEEKNAEIARYSTTYLCLFPTVLVCFTAYGEALALFLLVSTFYAIHKQRWWLAGLLGMLATLASSMGLLLLIPFCYEWWVKGNRQITRLLPVVLIGCGIVIFALYCLYTFGDALAFTAVTHWSRMLTWPWHTLWLTGVALFTLPGGSANQARLLLDLAAIIGFLTVLVIGWHLYRRSYTLWMGAGLLLLLIIPSSDPANPLLFSTRSVLLFFPAYIALAHLGKQRSWLHYAFLLVFASLQAVLSIAFIMGRWLA